MAWVSNPKMFFMCCRTEQMNKYIEDKGSQFLLLEKRVTKIKRRKTKINLTVLN